MLYSVKSNSSDYSIIKMNLDIPWKCDYVKYYVSSINTKANILMTTNDDYIEFEYLNNNQPICLTIQFKEMYNYSFNNLVNYLNNNCNSMITFKNVNNRTISLTPTHDIKFIGGTHRAKLIMGLYDTQFGYAFNQGIETTAPDLPILDFANKFYLVSLQGQAVHSSIGDHEYTPSVIANIDSMLIDGEPLIVNYDTAKPIKIKCNTDSLKYLEMRLVDFMFQPIMLKSPLFITLKIKPSNSADVYDVLTK